MLDCLMFLTFLAGCPAGCFHHWLISLLGANLGGGERKLVGCGRHQVAVYSITLFAGGDRSIGLVGSLRRPSRSVCGLYSGSRT